MSNVLNGLSQNDEYTLSPNPANSEVVVKGAKEIREITIIDLQGKELKSFYNTDNLQYLISTKRNIYHQNKRQRKQSSLSETYKTIKKSSF